jgi:hypothetical protein
MIRFFCLRATVACMLLFGPSFLMAGNGEMVVVHDTGPSGEVVLGRDDGADLHRGPIMRGVAYFDCTPNGRFVARTREGRWYRGDVRVPGEKMEILEHSVPQDAQYASIAPDGQTIAWRVPGRGKDSLIVRLHGDVEVWTDLYVISDNYIGAAAWSPSGDKLAYYSAGPDAPDRDGFRLMLLDTRDANDEPKQIAPPSLWTRLSPIRPDPPSWSPDGRQILFEGRYDDTIPFRTSCIVGVDGTALRPATPGTWSVDSTRLYAIERRDGQQEDPLVAIDIDPSGKEKRRTDLGVMLSNKCDVPRCSPTGRRLAYIEDGRIHVIDLTTKEDRILGEAGGISEIFWITRREGPGSGENLRPWVSGPSASASRPTGYGDSPPKDLADALRQFREQRPRVAAARMIEPLLKIGMDRKEVEELLGRPTKDRGIAWIYGLGKHEFLSDYWVLVFENSKLRAFDSSLRRRSATRPQGGESMPP